MKHLIIGSGVVGFATGLWLKANKEDVIFHDIDKDLLSKLEKERHTTSATIKQDIDIYWVCTAEWHVNDAMQKLDNELKTNDHKIIVIRSTTPPGTIDTLIDRYPRFHIIHIPEFLRASNAVEDTFNPDRIVIGSKSLYASHIVMQLFNVCKAPVLFVEPTTSEMVKYASNCWLSVQISYWGEIKSICDRLNINPQEVANVSSLDRRISSYGTAMLGSPFGKFCLPKDLDSLIKTFEEHNIDPVLLKAVKKVNER